MDIKAHLTKINVTQMEVARAMGWSQQMASLVMNGRRKVPLAKMKAFEKCTGLSRKQFRPELFK